ncbi:MMPL family transporter, partial [Bacteriovoracaceae bacterium]|nr:MMPL family transporter [Bacteriovoracaceae bacterium]
MDKKYALGLTRYAIKYPKKVIGMTLLLTAFILTLSVVPALKPGLIPGLKPLTIDTDPENMLPYDEPARVDHDRLKKEMSLRDMIVVGVINETHPMGIYNIKSLQRIHELTLFAQEIEGVVRADVMAVSTVDELEQVSPGTVRFNWLMSKPPKTESDAQAIRQKAMRIPFLKDTVISGNGKGVGIYLPIESKDQSYRIHTELKKKIATFNQDSHGDNFHIAGLPVAEDIFGVEMFKQMAIAAPMAMVIIFLLMFYFFRNLKLISSPMALALISVILTMGCLIISGNTIHIMSSMIPIFIMPIAVLDAVHILSEFFDRYKQDSDKKDIILSVIEELYTPLLFTSLTTMAGFASLAFTPIPPVQVFGIFVALGVFFAWILTMTFVPAFVMMMKDESFANFGLASFEAKNQGKLIPLFLQKIGNYSFHQSHKVILLLILMSSLAIYGVT